MKPLLLAMEYTWVVARSSRQHHLHGYLMGLDEDDLKANISELASHVLLNPTDSEAFSFVHSPSKQVLLQEESLNYLSTHKYTQAEEYRNTFLKQQLAIESKKDASEMLDAIFIEEKLLRAYNQTNYVTRKLIESAKKVHK